MSRHAIVVGATGLVGGELLNLLSSAKFFDTVLVLTRKPVIGLPSHFKNIIMNFSDDKDVIEKLRGTDLFFCFGTTLKTAGSKEKFVEIEWEGSRRLLQAAKKNGVLNLYLVSAMGANARASILYNRIKGQIEELSKELGFQSVTVFRPSLLLGERHEARISEGWAQKLIGPLRGAFVGPLLKYRPVEGELVATRLIEKSQNPLHGFEIVENDSIVKGWATR